MRTWRGKRALLVSLSVLLLGGTALAVSALSAPAKQDFALSVASAQTTVARGSSGTNTATITPSGGFSGTVSLTASGVPSGVTATIGATGNSRAITLAAAATAQAGSSTVTITGKSGSLTHTASFTLTVTAPDFAIAASPTSLTIVRGQSAGTTVTLTPTGGFTGSVTLSTSMLPSGITVSYGSPNPSSATSRPMTFTASTSAAPGTYPVTITATSGSLQHSTPVSLVVPKPTFTVAVSNDNLNLPRGTSGAYTVAITRQNGYLAAVCFTVTGVPAATTATFVPQSATTGNSVTLQIATTANTVQGSYTLTITGTGSDGLKATTTAHLTVSAGNGGNTPFTISGSPTTSLAPGVSAPIDLAIYNPNNQPLQVTGLTVTAASTTKPSCDLSNYTVKQFSGAYPVIPANSTKTLSQLGFAQSAWPAISMIDKPVNQDACKGATVQLGYSGAGSGS